MKITTGKEWVLGAYDQLSDVETVVRRGLEQGIPKSRFSIFTYQPLDTSRLEGIKHEVIHGEYKWVLRSAILGFLLGMIGHAMATLVSKTPYSEDWLMAIFMGLYWGIGGGLLGAFMGLIASGTDNAVSSFYETNVSPDKVLLGICTEPHNQAEILKAEELISESGVQPMDLPAATTTWSPSSADEENTRPKG